MFLLGIGIHLGVQHLQGPDDSRTGGPGFNHIVHVSPFRRHVRIGEFLPVFLDQFFLLRLGILGFRNLLFEDDVDGPFGPMTAISAVGQAKLTSPRICFEFITS